MRVLDPISSVLWLDVREFSRVLMKSQKTIWGWCLSGFIVELGYILEKDPTGHYRIGITPSHPCYTQFYRWTSLPSGTSQTSIVP